MHIYVVCDFRENFDNALFEETSNEHYNDHPPKKNILEILSCLKELGYDCSYFGGIPELVHAVDMHMHFPDSLFLNFTDGMSQNYSRVQAPALLDILGVKYSGSGVFASVLMNNKFFCKKALQDSGVQMPKDCIINDVVPFDEKQVVNWKFPLFIKPNCEGSSIGITERNICHNMADVYSNIERLLPDYRELILEEFIDGIDITNYLIGNTNSYFTNEVITARLNSKSDYAIYGAKEKHCKTRTLCYNEEYLRMAFIFNNFIKVTQFIFVLNWYKCIVI